jgi:polyhydroxyalkanoate synthesis regulator phasin
MRAIRTTGNMKRAWVRGVVLLAALLMVGTAQADTQQSAEELRNTLVNLLETLVQKGVITREQANAMVADAQAKADAEAKKRAQQEASEKDAVRVPYVPQTVREELSKEIGAQLRDQVARDVITQAKEERWGVPGALPDWVNAIQFFGDVRVRGEEDNYAKGNATDTYLNYDAVNAAGGISQAGLNALINTTKDRTLMFGRLRFGMDARLGNDFTADVRLASGSTSPVSANQQLGTYGQRWFLGVDRAALLYNPYFSDRTQEIDLRFGRFANPFVTYNELVWDVDVNFEGLSATYALHLFDDVAMGSSSRTVFVTAGAFPLQSVAQTASVFSSVDSKWLYGGQLGGEIPYGDNDEHRVRVTVGFYDFVNVTGVENPPNSTIEDFTVPAYMQKGNTVFDIANSSNYTTNAFALAGKYREGDANLLWDVAGWGENRVLLGADYVKNFGWKEQQVYMLTGQMIRPRVVGWEVGVDVGRPTLTAAGQWRAYLSYKSVQRDAVLDAFTDSDFHLGGTDARGYIVGFDIGLSKGTGLRLRYLSANAIDGPPLGIDVLQLDLLGQF